MKQSEYLLQSFVRAGATLLYVLCIALFFANAKTIFGDKEPRMFIPVFMLLLLIISATITGFLVLWKPISLYLNNFKKEAFIFLSTTLAWLFAFLLLTGFVLVITK